MIMKMKKKIHKIHITFFLDHCELALQTLIVKEGVTTVFYFILFT